MDIYTTKSGNGTFDALKALVVDVNNDLFLDTEPDGVDNIGNAGFAIADAIVTNTTDENGVTAKVATSVAYKTTGQVVTYTVTLTGNASADTTVTLALTRGTVDGNATCDGTGVASTGTYTAKVDSGHGDGATITRTTVAATADITAATVTLS